LISWLVCVFDRLTRVGSCLFFVVNYCLFFCILLFDWYFFLKKYTSIFDLLKINLHGFFSYLVLSIKWSRTKFGISFLGTYYIFSSHDSTLVFFGNRVSWFSLFSFLLDYLDLITRPVGLTNWPERKESARAFFCF
jgi:hypothetical protein